MTDSAAPNGTKAADLTIGKPATPATWRRAQVNAYCKCGGLLDLTRDDTPEKRTGPNRTRIACPCQTCGEVVYLTGKEMVDIARTLARRHAPQILAALVNRARRLDELVHGLMDEDVLVPHEMATGTVLALPATPEEIAKVSGAALAHETLVLRAAGVDAEKVEVSHRFEPSDGDPDFEARLAEAAARAWERLNGRVIDVTPLPPKGKK